MAFAGVLDALPQGLIFTDASRRALWWNRYAEALLSSHDGIWLDSQGLRTACPADADRLDGLIRQAAGANAPASGAAMSISRRSMRRPYAVLVCPVRRGATSIENAAVAILISDPERQPRTSPERLAAQFRLSPAEARVAAALTEGKSPESAAEELSLAQATVRAHIRSLLIKTSTSRQADLVRVLLSGPAIEE